MTNDIVVSVWMTTYNHEQYIGQAIDSIISQKTDYKYEIVIGDDCSSDETRTILLSYKEEYPDIIRLLFNEKNLGITANVYNVKCNCRGKYIVNLSGDDYWIDDRKIQKQVDFLELHKDYVAVCCTVAIRHDFETYNYGYYPQKRFRGKEYTLDNFAKGVLLPGHGMMMRNVFLSSSGREHFSVMTKFSHEIDDLADPILILEEGRVFILNDIMTVYRTISSNKRSGKSNFNSKFTYAQKFERIVKMNNALHIYLNEKVDLSQKYIPYISLGLIDSVSRRSFAEFKEVYNLVPAYYKQRGIFLRSVINVPVVGIKKFYNRYIKAVLYKLKY